MASTELKRKIFFNTKLAKKYNHFLRKDKVCPIVVVDNKEDKYKYEWTESTFKHRLQKIRELLKEDSSKNKFQSKLQKDDPLWDPP